METTSTKCHNFTFTIRGIKCKLGSTGARKPRLPITPELLKLIKSHIHKKVFPRSDSAMLWSACCLVFFGFLRSSESTQSFHQAPTLQFQDINVDDSSVHLTVKASKTDPFREGVTLLIASTGTSVCPVSALQRYLKYSKVSQGPLFQFSDGRFLTRTLISRTVREALSNQGLDIKRYSSHSFRIGAASAASAAGLSDSLIKSLDILSLTKTIICLNSSLKVLEKRLKRFPIF